MKTDTIHTKRKETVFAVFENELDTLSNYNMLSTGCFAFGSIFLEKSINAINSWSAFFQNYHFVLLLVILYGLGGMFFCLRKGLTNKIKQTSEVICYKEEEKHG